MSHPEEALNRNEKLTALRQQGVQPYGARYERTAALDAIVSDYAEGRQVTVAGRLVAKRGHGGLTFADLRDAGGKIQICMRKQQIGEEAYQRFSLLDLGDILGVQGTLFKTKTGEVTVQVSEWTLLSKALQPLPEKWHGLKDVEIRYRQRYLDLIVNEPVRQVFVQRSKLLTSLRRSLEQDGFLEVETPMMHPIPGGAAGDPFITHHNALDMDLYLRLAPELYLKKLLVGGLEKVYEINRCFRNEGLSTQHNPEFTMLEAYAAYEDCAYMMRLVQKLITRAADELLGTRKLQFRGETVDLDGEWPVLSFAKVMEDLGLPAGSPEGKIQQVLGSRGIKVKGMMNRSQLVRLVEQLFEPKAKEKPLFVIDFWTDLSPLAKSKPDNPLIADRFELYVGGMEVANAYSELNDPIEQRKRFEAQLEQAPGEKPHGDGAALERKIDESFLEALEHGMPPAGGLGVGIDRLLMLLLDQPSIKDVILFPLLKPVPAEGPAPETEGSKPEAGGTESEKERRP